MGDDDVLRMELAALQDEAFDLALTGFDADALAEILTDENGAGSGETDDDAVPEVTETPISRPGDIWVMGPHRLLCGDATLAESYQKLLGDGTVDMVFTDPPYNVNYANSAKDKLRGKDRAILNDNLGDGFYDFILAALTPMLSRCQGAVYVAMSSSERTSCRQRSVPQAGIGPPLSSGPRTPSPWAGPTTSASTNRSSTAGRTARSGIGAVTVTRVMSGRSRNRRRTICTQP